MKSCFTRDHVSPISMWDVTSPTLFLWSFTDNARFRRFTGACFPIKFASKIAQVASMAPVPDLHPIVIPPIEVKINNKTFTCAGDGFLKDGHGYESNLRPFLPLTEPKKTKSGSVATKQPTPKSKPLAFWKAQCVFRKYAQNGSIKVLQSRLGGIDPKMDKELVKEQTRVNKEFRIMNDEARKKSRSTLSTDEDKARSDPEKFLRDRFFRQTSKEPSGDGDTIVLKTNERTMIHQAARLLGLYTESVEAPLNADGSVPGTD